MAEFVDDSAEHMLAIVSICSGFVYVALHNMNLREEFFCKDYCLVRYSMMLVKRTKHLLSPKSYVYFFNGFLPKLEGFSIYTGPRVLPILVSFFHRKIKIVS